MVLLYCGNSRSLLSLGGHVTLPTVEAKDQTAQDYDVSPDGRRFVIVENVEVEPPGIHLVENWYEEFRDREQD